MQKMSVFGVPRKFSFSVWCAGRRGKKEDKKTKTNRDT